MTQVARKETVALDLANAEKALKAARALRDLGLVNDALSRLYFAAFFLVRALLSSEGVEAKSHRGVHSLIGLLFVKSGRLEKEHQQILSRLETWRNKADYERGFEEDPTLFDAEWQAALKLKSRIEELLRAGGFA